MTLHEVPDAEEFEFVRSFKQVGIGMTSPILAEKYV